MEIAVLEQGKEVDKNYLIRTYVVTQAISFKASSLHCSIITQALYFISLFTFREKE